MCVEHSERLVQEGLDAADPDVLAADQALYYWARRCWDEFQIPRPADLYSSGGSIQY